MDLKPSEIAKIYKISRQTVYDKQKLLEVSRKAPLAFTIGSVNRVFGSPPIDDAEPMTVEQALYRLEQAQNILLFLLKGSDHV